LQAPFPEEFNRQLVSKVSLLHFAPTVDSAENLIKEGHAESLIFVTGNTVIDSLFWMIDKIQSSEQGESSLKVFFQENFDFKVDQGPYVLITGHRRENMGDGFDEIFGAIAEVARKYPSISFVYPVHLNPKVKGPAHELLGEISNVYLIEPLQYEAFIYLLSNCHLLLTDSGGLQEEAPSLGKPVLVMRDVTERSEALKAGTVKLVGCDRAKIIKNISQLLDDEKLYAVMASAENPFGDGTSATKIVQKLKEFFGDNER
jgi:UDP-N-acetylglucosamine 2-epimerase (non-hydrolysing)